METSYHKCGAMLLTRHCAIQKFSGLLNEMMCIFVSQGTIKTAGCQIWKSSNTKFQIFSDSQL